MSSPNLSFHGGQAEILNLGNPEGYRPHPFTVAVMGRRYGKTNMAIKSVPLALQKFQAENPLGVDPISPETILISLPTLQMAKGLFWGPLVNMAEEGVLKPYVSKVDRSNHRIDFHGLPSIYVVGANDRNGDGLRGKRIYYFIGDEVQDFKRGIFDTVVVPAMADTQGSYALLTGTPKGTRNHLKELFDRAQSKPGWVSFNHPTIRNPYVPEDFLRQQKLVLPPRIYRQEFWASFETFPGQIYSSLGVGNICEGVPDNFDRVVIGVDFGDTHPAFSVLGLRAGRWYFLEGWAPSEGQPVPQPTQDSNLVRLASKYGAHGVLCDPSRPSSILAIRALGAQYKLDGLLRAIAGYNRIEEGLTQVHSLIYQKRLLFPKTNPHIVPRTHGLVTPEEAFRMAESYHRATDRDGLVTEKVADGQEDHILDALRYALATGSGADVGSYG